MSYMENPALMLGATYNSSSFRSLASAIREWQTKGPTAKDTLINSLHSYLAQSYRDLGLNPLIDLKSICSEVVSKMKYFNANIRLTQVQFKYGKDGKYEQVTSPIGLDYDDIENYGEGWIKLRTNDEIVAVTEDYKAIARLIDHKKKELEEYENHQKKMESLGLGDPPGEE